MDPLQLLLILNNIRDMYPRYLFTMDLITDNRDGINNVNIVNFINDNRFIINVIKDYKVTYNFIVFLNV